MSAYATAPRAGQGVVGARGAIWRLCVLVYNRPLRERPRLYLRHDRTQRPVVRVHRHPCPVHQGGFGCVRVVQVFGEQLGQRGRAGAVRHQPFPPCPFTEGTAGLRTEDDRGELLENASHRTGWTALVVNLILRERE